MEKLIQKFHPLRPWHVGVIAFALVGIVALLITVNLVPQAAETYPKHYTIDGTIVYDEGTAESNEIGLEVDVLNNADLSITKTHTGNFTVGLNGAYTITVRNDGPKSADTVRVTDTIPPGLAYVSATGTNWTCTHENSSVTCLLSGPLATNSSTSITLTVASQAAGVPMVTNAASVTSTGAPDNNPNNNLATDPTVVNPANPAADLSITKTHSGNFTVGQNGIYTITVTNAGPTATVAPIVIKDTLPESFDYVSASGTGWTCAPNFQVITCTRVNPLDVNGKSDISLAISPHTAGTYANVVVMTSEDDDKAANNTVQDSTVVNAAPAVVTPTPEAQATPAVVVPSEAPNTGRSWFLDWWNFLFN